jgi:ribosomal protein L29
MANKQQLENALIAAHNAGDFEAAKVFANEIKSMSTQPAQQPVQQVEQPEAPVAPLTERLGRQAGLTARYGLEGLGSIVDLAQTPVRGAMNLVLPENRQLQPVSFGGSIADVIGLPKPQNETERVVGDISRTMAGTGGVIKAAGAVSPTSAVGQGIRESLTSNVPTQLAGAVGGGGASGLTREAGGDALAQSIAGLVGGFGGGALVKPKPTGVSAQQLQNAPRDKVLKEAQKVGYVALPSDVGAGKTVRAMETVSGKFKAQELASAKNQQVTNNLTRKYLGVSEDTPLTTDVFDDLRNSFAEPYRAASQLPAGQIGTTSAKSLATGGKTTTPVLKNGAQLVEEIKIARDDSRAAWKSFNSGMASNPTEARKAAQAADSLVDTLEKQLDKLAQINNQPELLKSLNEARRNIAKVHTVEKATNPITGAVDAKAIARQVAKKAPVTGELQLVGKFAQAFPKVTKQVAEPPNAFSIYDIAGTSFGLGAANPFLASLPAARIAGRYGVLSQPVQQRFVQPQYEQPTTPFVPYMGLLNEEQ